MKIIYYMYTCTGVLSHALRSTILKLMYRIGPNSRGFINVNYSGASVIWTLSFPS